MIRTSTLLSQYLIQFLKIRLICIGNNKHDYIQSAIDDYSGRLRRFCQLEIIYIKSEKVVRGIPEQKILEEEKNRTLRSLHKEDYSILLDPLGKEYNSQEFAALFRAFPLTGKKQFNFIIGGPLGCSADLRKYCQFCLSLSRLTVTHQLARVFLLEQIYRALTIIHKHPYHK